MDRFTAIDGIISSIADNISKRGALQRLHHVNHCKVITHIIRGDCAHYYLSCICTHPYMNFTPGPPLRVSMLTDLPLALSKHLHTGRIKNYVQTFPGLQQSPHRNLQIPGSPAEY